MKSQSDQNGLTLIEVMIAIVIMATINLMAWRGIDIISRANTALELRGEERARLTRALQQLERDIAWHTTVELPPTTPPLPASSQITTKRPQSMAWLPAGMDISRPAASQLLLTVVRAAPAAPGRWQRVQWWVQNGTLYRSAGEPADQYPIPDPRPAERVAVLNGVSTFDIQAWEPGRGWQVLPTTRQPGSTATGLQITFGIRRSAGPAWQYRRVLAFN